MPEVPGNGNSLMLLEALDRLRADFKADLSAHEHRMTDAIDDVRNDVQRFVIEHGKLHEGESQIYKANDERFQAFIDSAKVTKAHREGMLSMILLIITTLGKNWQLLATVVVFIMTVVFGARIEFSR